MIDCYICGKKDISKNEIGLTKKLLGKNSIVYPVWLNNWK